MTGGPRGAGRVAGQESWVAVLVGGQWRSVSTLRRFGVADQPALARVLQPTFITTGVSLVHCRCFGAEEFNREPGAFSIAWDKPFYRYPVLHPIAWVLERLISTPATHHAHHAASTDDGIG